MADEKKKLTIEEVKAQIESLDIQIANFTQQLFKAQGARQLAQHMLDNFDLEERIVAPTGTA